MTLCLPYKTQPVRQLLLAMSLVAAAFLGFALISQYGFHLHPCDLCIKQRIPYAIIVALGAISLLAVKSERMIWNIALLCAALFFADALIAGYHAGVELGIFPGPSGCSAGAAGEQSIEQMRAAILNAPLVTCDQAMAQFLGLSMAAWNGGAALIVTLFSLCALKRLRKGLYA